MDQDANLERTLIPVVGSPVIRPANLERSLIPVVGSPIIRPSRLNNITQLLARPEDILQSKQEFKTEIQFKGFKVIQEFSQEIVYDNQRPKSVRRTIKQIYKNSVKPKIKHKHKHNNKNKSVSNEYIKKEDSKSNNIIRWIFLLLIGLILSFLLYYIFNYYYSTYRHCHFHYNTPLIKSNLEKHIFGQKEVIDSIINNLEEFRDNNYSKSLIFVFTGTTGVGKSYTARILTSFFKNTDYYFINNHELPIYIKHSNCDNENIIVVDDIDNSTVTFSIHWLQEILKTEPKTKTLFILVINLKNHVNYDPSSAQESLPENQEIVKNLFGQIKIPNIHFIDFKLLSRDSVIKCINDAAKRFYQKASLTDEEIEEILNRLPEQNCKRIYNQVEYLLANV